MTAGAGGPAGPGRWSRLIFGVVLAVHLLALYVPRAPAEPSGVSVDKAVHVVIFGAVLVAGGFAGLPARPLAVLLLVHAPVSELAQHYLLPHRDGSVADALADVVGVLLALPPTLRIRRRGRGSGSRPRDSADAAGPAR